MPTIRADELTEDDIILETWTESDPPTKLPLRILSIVKEDDTVNVLFFSGKDFTYPADCEVEVEQRGRFVSER